MKQIALLIIIGSLAFFITHVHAQDGLIDTTPSDGLLPESEAGVIASKFITEINILNNVQLDDSIFKNLSFKSLQDFSKPIPDEASGRPNPFAPL